MRRLRPRALLITLGIAWMEGSWIALLFAVMARRFAPHPLLPTAAVAAGLMLLPAFIVWWMDRLGLPLGPQRALVILSLALLVLGVLFLHVFRAPIEGSQVVPSLLAAAICGLIGWRGLELGQLDLSEPNGVLFRFWIGLSMLVLVLPLAFIMAPIGADPMTGLEDLDWLLPLFFLVSLSVLGLARLEEVTHMVQSTPVLTLGRRWIGLTVGLAAVAVLAGLALLPLLTGGQLTGVLAWLWPPLRWVGQLLSGIIVVLAMIIWLLMTPLVALLTDEKVMEQIGEAMDKLREGVDTLGDIFGELNGPTSSLPPQVATALQLGLLALVVTLAVFGILRTVRRPKRRQVSWETEEHDRMELRGEGRRLSLLERLRRRAQQIQIPAFLASLSIRRIYANLTRLATRQGFPRRPAQTPYEYLPALRQAFPECEEEVRAITQAYVWAHYGQVPDTREDLNRLRQAWQRVRGQAREP